MSVTGTRLSSGHPDTCQSNPSKSPHLLLKNITTMSADLTPPPPASGPLTERRSIVIGKLSKLALLKAALAQIAAPHLTQIAAIQAALHQATAADVLEIDILENEIKAMAAEFPDEVFGEGRTVKLNNLSLGARRTDKVELDGTEEDIVSALERLEKNSEPAAALYAAACLRKTVELNKAFIRQQWEKEGAAEWFAALGITVKESTSVSISEVKPPKAKVTKSKDKPGSETPTEPES